MKPSDARTHAQVFDTAGKNNERVMVAGLIVFFGKLSRAHYFRVLRDEEVLADRVKATSMRRHKDRVNEVTKDKVSQSVDCPAMYKTPLT